MCISCGCGGTDAHEASAENAAVRPPAATAAHWHQHADGSWHSHSHDRSDANVSGAHHADHEHEPDHDAAHTHEHEVACETGVAAAASPSERRRVQVERDVLGKNDAIAARNRQRMTDSGSLALNLVSSPGSGKTTLLCRTIQAFHGVFPVVVIEGDQQTTIDADRIRATGAPALQINTGKGCHLDAAMIESALVQLDPAEQTLVLIENVGNLVCPAAFDLGEDAKVVVLSVTEGDDKPLKYPDMFAAARLMLVNKVDLQPYCDFDLTRAFEFARRINPMIEMIALSARDGSGFDAWLAWIEQRRARKKMHANIEDALATR